MNECSRSCASALRHRDAARFQGRRVVAYGFGNCSCSVARAAATARARGVYSPSSRPCLVAYIQDQAALGGSCAGCTITAAWRSSVVAGLHPYDGARRCVQDRRASSCGAVVSFARARPRWAVTALVLRWDQRLLVNRVEVGNAAGTPVLGDTIQSSPRRQRHETTLTRFYTLHVSCCPNRDVSSSLPLLSRRHGPKPMLMDRPHRAGPIKRFACAREALGSRPALHSCRKTAATRCARRSDARVRLATTLYSSVCSSCAAPSRRSTRREEVRDRRRFLVGCRRGRNPGRA